MNWFLIGTVRKIRYLQIICEKHKNIEKSNFLIKKDFRNFRFFLKNNEIVKFFIFVGLASVDRILKKKFFYLNVKKLRF